MAIRVAADAPAKTAKVNRAARLRPFTEKNDTHAFLKWRGLYSMHESMPPTGRASHSSQFFVRFFALFSAFSAILRYPPCRDPNGALSARPSERPRAQSRSRTNVMRNLTHVMRTLVFIGDCRKNRLVTTNSTALKNDTSPAED